MDDLQERTEASLEKYRERALQLREDLGDARAATKVQMKAMIERLEEKYEEAEEEFDRLKKAGSTTRDEWQKLHDEVVSEFQTMAKTIRRRIR